MAQKGYIKNGTTADLGAPELAAIFKGILPNSGIVDIFDDLACARVNDNLVRLSPGVYNLSGYILGVAQGTTADLAVDSGTAGYNRIDLLIAEFVRNGGGAGIDTLVFRILKGTSTTGTAVAPTLTQEDINGLGTTRQEALYRLNITGTTLAAPVLLAGIAYAGAPLDSPTFTGTPAAPTAAASTDTTQLATTAFVHDAIGLDAPDVLLAEYEVTGSAVTSIDFTGLDINSHKSYRIEIEAYNPAATESFVYAYINNDTVGSNYYSQQQKTDGTGVTAGRANSAALFWVGAGQRMSGDAKLAITPGGYAMAVSNHTSNPSSLLARQIYAWVKMATVSNVTQITLVGSTASSLGIGTKVRIYRGDA